MTDLLPIEHFKDYKFPDIKAGDMIRATHTPILSIDDPHEIHYREVEDLSPVLLVLEVGKVERRSPKDICFHRYTVMNVIDGSVYEVNYPEERGQILEVVA